MTNIQQGLAQASQQIERLDAEVLLAFVLNKPRSFLYTWPEQLLDTPQLQQFELLITEKKQGKPTAYLTGVQEFWSLPLSVNPHTLIPRPETEQLVDAVLNNYPASTPLIVWDAGTGSGAIALALKHERPNWHVFASDLSANALAAAQQNSHKLALPIHFIHAAWLGAVAPQSLDILVSNPPYIAEYDEHLADLRHEPLSALVAENQGMADIEQLCAQAKFALKPQGRFYVEHGYNQQEPVEQVFLKHGFSHICCYHDYAGLPRFTCGQKP